MTISAPISTRPPEPADDDAGSVALDQATLLRDALGPLVASGHRLVADVSRVEFFGSTYVGALLGTLAVARRIPAVESVLEALRRLETGDGTALPLVAPDKLNC